MSAADAGASEDATAGRGTSDHAFVLAGSELVMRRGLFLPRLELFNHFPEFVERDVLNLPHPLARHAEFLPDFLQRFLRAAIQSKPVAQNRGLALIERLDHLLQHPG